VKSSALASHLAVSRQYSWDKGRAAASRASGLPVLLPSHSLLGRQQRSRRGVPTWVGEVVRRAGLRPLADRSRMPRSLQPL